MKNKNILILFFLLLFLPSCKDESIPPKPDAILRLALDDVSCTEAWLTLSTTNLQLPTSLNLLKDDNSIKTINLETTDTLLYIDSLLPNQTYNLQLTSIQNPVSSNQLSVTTMDTTSHNFTFEKFEFGTIGSSVLFDVAIINEKDIWAVGEIMIADTSANGYTTYNAVHWDGHEWHLKMIGNQGGWACHTVYAFSETEVWFEGVIKWDGANYSVHNNGFPKEPNGVAWRINKMWGSSSTDLYAVGNGGNIAHYNGSQWRRIESGTTLNINDIWGDYNNKTGEWEILAAGGNILQGGELERVILKIESSGISTLIPSGANWPLRTIWFKSAQKYFVAGSGIYEKNNLSQNVWSNNIFDITSYSINKLRGDDINDICAVGGVGEIVHFNGYDWKSYFDQTALTGGNYYGVSIKNNMIVSSGQSNSRAIITIGKRTN